MAELELTGLELAICMRATLWAKDFPFKKISSPHLRLTIEEMNECDKRLEEVWTQSFYPKSIAIVSECEIVVMLPQSHINCLRECIGAVLLECEGNPIELRVRVGPSDAVRNLHQRLALMVP